MDIYAAFILFETGVIFILLGKLIEANKKIIRIKREYYDRTGKVLDE